MRRVTHAQALQPCTPDWGIAKRAGSQHGLITFRQLRELGISANGVAHRTRIGRLHRVYRGVYSVGHSELRWEAQCMAAVLAVGEGSAVAAAAASRIHGVDRTRFRRVPVIVVSRRRHGGLHEATVRYSRSLVEEDITVVDRIPVTTVERTIRDEAAGRDAEYVANLLDEAAFWRKLDIEVLDRVIERCRHARGNRTILRARELHLGGSAGTKSNLERRVLRLIRAADLPEPMINVKVRFGRTRYELDLHWPAARLCVEVDGGGHEMPRRKAKDDDRDAVLAAHGWTTLRVSESMVDADPDGVVELISAALASA